MTKHRRAGSAKHSYRSPQTSRAMSMLARSRAPGVSGKARGNMDFWIFLAMASSLLSRCWAAALSTRLRKEPRRVTRTRSKASSIPPTSSGNGERGNGVSRAPSPSRSMAAVRARRGRSVREVAIHVSSTMNRGPRIATSRNGRGSPCGASPSSRLETSRPRCQPCSRRGA